MNWQVGTAVKSSRPDHEPNLRFDFGSCFATAPDTFEPNLRFGFGSCFATAPDTFEPNLSGPAFLLPGHKPGPAVAEPRQAAVAPRRLFNPWDHRSRD
jgi:hypothetical protein